MNTEKLKKLSIQVMIGSLITAAVIAIAAVLAGSFNEVFARALGTLFLVMFHALACLAFIGQTIKAGDRNFKFFENTVFFIIVLSFFTSIFGVWGLFGGEILARLYGTYFVFLFASLHGQMLAQTTGKQSHIDGIVNANFGIMTFVVLLIIPVVWLSSDSLPGFYYRILAAVGIIDATLTILAVILHRMYIQKHPEEQSVIFSVATTFDGNGNPVATPAIAQDQPRHFHPLLWLLGIYLIGQVAASIFFAALR